MQSVWDPAFEVKSFELELTFASLQRKHTTAIKAQTNGLLSSSYSSQESTPRTRAKASSIINSILSFYSYKIECMACFPSDAPIEALSSRHRADKAGSESKGRRRGHLGGEEGGRDTRMKKSGFLKGRHLKRLLSPFHVHPTRRDESFGRL